MTAVGRGLLFLGLLLAVGACFGRWVLRPEASAERKPAGASPRVPALLGVIGAEVCVIGLAVLFWGQISAFRDPFAPWGDEALLLLTGTGWGRAWTWGALVALVLQGAFFLAWRAQSAAAWGIATASVLGLIFLPAFTGHAVGSGAWAPVAIVADALHVGAAGVWMGGLAAVLWMAPLRDAPKLARLTHAFSPWAQRAVATLLATGGFAAWLHLPSLPALISSTYGRWLLAKIGVVGVVLLLGWLNWKVRTPRLLQRGETRALRRSAVIELALGLGVTIAVTAILVETSPG